MQSVRHLIDFQDILIAIPYLIVFLIFSSTIKNRNINKYPEFKYFRIGLFFKIIGVLLFCLVYVFYYEGGDTINYFYGSKSLVNVFFQSPINGFHIIFNTSSPENTWMNFNEGTGYPPVYMWLDPKTFSVCRLTTIFYILGSGNFLITSFFTAIFEIFSIITG